MMVAPAPCLVALEGCDHRMTGRIEMLQGVCMLRILAASDMTTGQAHAKLVPCRAEREAFLAAVGASLHLPNFTEMFATLTHVPNADVGQLVESTCSAGPGAKHAGANVTDNCGTGDALPVGACHQAAHS